MIDNTKLTKADQKGKIFYNWRFARLTKFEPEFFSPGIRRFSVYSGCLCNYNFYRWINCTKLPVPLAETQGVSLSLNSSQYIYLFGGMTTMNRSTSDIFRFKINQQALALPNVVCNGLTIDWEYVGSLLGPRHSHVVLQSSKSITMEIDNEQN